MCEKRHFLFVLLLFFVSIATAQKGSDCVTPNKENAKCILVSKCDVIVNAVRTRNETAIKFARDSHCGFDGQQPLVCCGTKGYPDDLSFLLGIFQPDKLPERNKPDQEKQELESVILQNFNTKELPDRTVCGLEKEGNRIYGGEQAELDEFPWMVAMEYVWKKDQSPADIRCGGSLINNRYVLTAAHCLLDREFELTRVRLGEWNTTADPDCIEYVANNECADPVVVIDVAEQIPHPFYSKRTSNNDIGLVKLATDIKFSNFIRPICLPPQNLPAPPFQSLMTVAGWGITENQTTSDVKLKVEVPLLKNELCREKLDGKPVGANQLCAGGEYGKDSCRGDSGGPLMRAYEDTSTKQKQWYQEGVVASGLGCARLGYPAIYSRVSRYINWIINNISSD